MSRAHMAAPRSSVKSRQCVEPIAISGCSARRALTSNHCAGYQNMRENSREDRAWNESSFLLRNADRQKRPGPRHRGTRYDHRGIMYLMAFTVKDDEVIQLADELAKRMHLPSRIDAIRHALRAQIEVTQTRTGNRADELLDVLRTEIWPLFPAGSPITKAVRENILGYNPETGVSQ